VNAGVETAFVLGAGLGTRLKALTADRPKPMVPVVGKPLITFAFDHLIAAGVTRFVVNTHHRAEAYHREFPGDGKTSSYRGCGIQFCHEPTLLDTGGGIKNVRDLVGGAPFLVHNGDVLADLDMESLVASHMQGGHLATLGLRTGEPAQIDFDVSTRLVTDIRGVLGKPATRKYLFTGIYVLSPGIFDYFPDEDIFSIVTTFLALLGSGLPVGGVVLDEGRWFDLGTIEAYKDVHHAIAHGLRFSHQSDPDWPQFHDPGARVGPGVHLAGMNAIGAGAMVGEGTRLENCILWPGSKTASRLNLRDCIVRTSVAASAESKIL
jgi:NDP-sugar pyrophosphorylase family protein